MSRKRRPRYVLWGHRGEDWTPGREPICTIANASATGFGPWEPVRVTLYNGRAKQTLWVLLR